MPYINVRILDDGVTAEQKAEVIAGITDIMVRVLNKTPESTHVVIDEVMGMLITMFLNPSGWIGALLGFFLFRVFDVVKPYPSDRLEKLHGGVGVMADDGMAAVYANAALRACLWLSARVLMPL